MACIHNLIDEDAYDDHQDVYDGDSESNDDDDDFHEKYLE